MTTKAELLRRIRDNCIECMGGVESEIQLCASPKCKFFEFRSGRDPRPCQSKSEAARVRALDHGLGRQNRRSHPSPVSHTGDSPIGGEQ